MDHFLAFFSGYVSILCGCAIVMNDDVIIKVEGLWKRYGLPLVPAVRGLVHRLRSGKGSISNEGGPWALRDVSFEVKQGETLGIIGRNGAGKSTLLKILAGVTPPTRGQIEVRGRVFPMIELNAGIHPELTGRENVHLLAAIMGLSRQEVEAKVPEIEEFTELEEWFDQPVRKYSSGMLARLGFGVAMNVEANVLLIDEVMAVGDLVFQRKCYDRIEQLHSSKVTILLVSHSIRQVERLCSKTMWLRNGAIAMYGDVQKVCDSYYSHSSQQMADITQRSAGTAPQWVGTGEVEVIDIKLLNHANREISAVLPLDYLRIRVAYEAREEIVNPIIGINFYPPEMFLLSAFTTENCLQGKIILKGSDYFDCTIPRVPFLPGSYLIGIRIKARNNRTVYQGDHLAQLHIDYSPDTKTDFGLVHTDVEWDFNHCSDMET